MRFVILHHVIHAGEHWDLMLERRGVLLTWQLAREPVGRKDLPIAAQRIGDHRMAYLDYEGAVSHDRGFVSRVDEGALEGVEEAVDRLTFELCGRRLIGRFQLRRIKADDWSFESVAASLAASRR